MSLRASLSLLITALLLLVMLLGTLLLLGNAREQVRAEVDAVSAMVSRFADPAGPTLSMDGATGRPVENALHDLKHLRHIRVAFRDASGTIVSDTAPQRQRDAEHAPPAWFADLMTHNLTPVSVERDLPAGDGWPGTLVIQADPSYEIAEVWEDSADLLWLVASFFVAVNLLVYWAVGRALKPVGRILAALNELERGHLEARLPTFEMKELSDIGEKFNRMAQTLQTSITRNHRLSQRLIYLQEEERRGLARDLHDELGQCLTAILADGTALVRLSEERFPEAQPSAQAVVEVTHRVMATLRAVLQRLRPELLDGLGLQPALEELVDGWRQRHPQAACVCRMSGDLDGLSDQLRITVYRVVQECLTNINRHAQARRVRIDVGRHGAVDAHQGETMLRIEVEDDGRGFDPERAAGFGLSGMRERVEGLGGSIRIESSVGSGTRITATLPVRARP